MNELENDNVVRGDMRFRKSKAQLADYYSVGLRTIEEWLARGIISGARQGRALQFDVAECDQRISSFKNRSEANYGIN